MARSVLICIKRKTKVPTKKQIIHLYRSDWKIVYKISYIESANMFKVVNKRHGMERDSQFCKWILDNFGPGIYLCLAWRKFYSGFWSFMKVEIQKDYYKRLPKRITQEEKELKQELAEAKKLKEQLEKTSNIEKREEIMKEIKENEEMLNLSGEINELSKGRKRGPSPYLKAVQPVYAPHEYENYLENNNSKEVKQRIW